MRIAITDGEQGVVLEDGLARRWLGKAVRTKTWSLTHSGRLSIPEFVDGLERLIIRTALNDDDLDLFLDLLDLAENAVARSGYVRIAIEHDIKPKRKR